MMLPDRLSERMLDYVQQCQVAVLAHARDDYAAQVVSIWSCLAVFPDFEADGDILAGVASVALVAAGFFAAHNARASMTRGASVDDLLSRRRHANNVLRLALDRYADPALTITAAAAELGLSEAFLSRALSAETRRCFRSAFRNHLNVIRVLAAIERMRTSAEQICSIAARVGYISTGELDRQFHRMFGLSPTRFRDALRLVHHLSAA